VVHVASVRALVYAAATRLGLFAYSSLVHTTLKLLRCEKCAPKDLLSPRCLVIQRDVLCSAVGWQAPLWILLAFLFLFPGLLAAFLRHAIRESRRGSEDYALVVANMCSVYHDKVYWWEGVLLLQRFILNVVHTFGAELPLARSLIAIAVCLGFLLLHMSVRPMRHSAGAAAQTTFQTCLLCIAILSCTLVAEDTMAKSGMHDQSRIFGDDASGHMVDMSLTAATFLLPAIVLVLQVGRSSREHMSHIADRVRTARGHH